MTLHIPKHAEWEPGAFKFYNDCKEEITAVLTTKEDHHQIAFRVNKQPRRILLEDVCLVARQFLEPDDLFFLSSKSEIVPGAQRIVYYPWLKAN